MGTLLTFAVYAIATVSAAVFIKDDELFRGPRTWFMKRAPTGSLRAYWWTCIKCVSMLPALGTATAWVLVPEHPVAKIAAAALAFRWLSVKMYTWQRLLQGKTALYETPPADEQEAR